LYLHCVLGHAIGPFDSQTLLDPLEEEFDLPEMLVEIANRQRWKRFMVGQRNPRLGSFELVESDAPQMRGMILPIARPIQRDGLVGDHAALSIGGCGIDPMGFDIGLRAGDEECAGLVQRVQTCEVDTRDPLDNWRPARVASF